MKKLDDIKDKREPSTCHAPYMAKCPVEDCEDRGRYTNCYLVEMLPKCHIYAERQ